MHKTILALALATCAVAAPAQTTGPGGRAVDWEKVNPTLHASMQADRAAPKPDAVIAYGSGPQHRGELRVPVGPGPHPVAIVIHGGCWLSRLGDQSMPAFSESLRRRGIATWDIDYRRVGHAGGGWPGTFQDITAGADHLPRLAKEHGLDMSRVIVVGHSAGAHLALWNASRPRLGGEWASGAEQPKPMSVVAIDGPAALAPFVGIDAQVCDEPVIVPLMGGTPAERPAEYRLATPAAHLPLGPGN
ncbi:alpha/beta hydrolase family protein [Qipengyuania sediminis]|uniref:alpha/beta hydrolase family protein n=1 Tax=Qipengyuania sediminis TaxID=1532023 RepID=UPI0010595C1F|nr:alpha/beta hydrolase [Qipengyuania sediminis]